MKGAREILFRASTSNKKSGPKPASSIQSG
jgi:hypothetical protein